MKVCNRERLLECSRSDGEIVERQTRDCTFVWCVRRSKGCEMILSQALPSRITLADALEFSRTLAKHNPFVRMQPQEQELANQAGTLLSRMANTEELEFLMRDEKWKALF